MFFLRKEEDQKSAFSGLQKLMDEMAKSEMVFKNDPEMVDIRNYKEVPDDIAKGKTETAKSKSTAGVSTSKVGNRANTSGVTAPYNNYTAPYKRKEAAPFVWKRKSRKPTETALLELTKKLDLLKSDELEIKIPELPGKEETPETNNSYMDDGFGMCC